jgi:NAD(P)H-flavin reductase
LDIGNFVEVRGRFEKLCSDPNTGMKDRVGMIVRDTGITPMLQILCEINQTREHEWMKLFTGRETEVEEVWVI